MAEEPTFEVILAESFGQTLEMVEAALQQEAFEVVTRFDVQRTMQDKLHVSLRPYIILGAVNNRIADQLLRRDPCVALMVPCNISVEVTPDERTLVRVTDPGQMVSCKCGEDPTIVEIAEDASRRLANVIQALGRASRPPDPNAKPWTRLSQATTD